MASKSTAGKSLGGGGWEWTAHMWVARSGQLKQDCNSRLAIAEKEVGIQQRGREMPLKSAGEKQPTMEAEKV